MLKERYADWETIIGLEIHVELNTQSKLFSHAYNRFGDEPNTNISVVCTGQPGTLPVLNKEVVKKAVAFGCAVKGRVATWSKFDRKSYFYPDSPRNFQITQFDFPIVVGGEIVADVDGKPKTFQIDRAHIEDDAGMLKHFTEFAGVDYNRAGVPLIEIVSQPCMHSAEDAVAYAKGIKAIMEYLEASDCNMEEGSLRMDVNISVRKKGEPGFRNKVEIKNMNSFTFMAEAIEYEVERQIEAYLKHSHLNPKDVITPSTLRWDTTAKKTILMRKKETADDYRYFPEPDLPPLVLSEEFIDSVRKTLPELPYQREKRYIEQFDLSPYNAGVLINEKKLSDYFEKGLKVTSNAKALCSWITVEFAGRFKDQGISIWESSIPSEHIAQLVQCIDQNMITGKIAKSIADEMVAHPHKSCLQIIEENPDYRPMNDSHEIEKIIDEVLQQNPQSIEDYKNGKVRAYKHLIGQVMKLSKGKASPDIANALLQQRLGPPPQES